MTLDLSFIVELVTTVCTWSERNPILATIIATGAFLHMFFALYVVVTGLYRAHLDKTLTKAGYILGYPLLILAGLVDVIAQFTIFTIVFVEPPQELLVTDRLRRYLLAGEDVYGWRHRAAKYICGKLLDYFDPRGGHCIPLKP